MSKERQAISDEALDQVVGGWMHFDYNNQTLKYTHEETGAVTYYEILDFENAWKTSNSMHGDNIHEDKIIAKLKSKHYIK